MHCTKLIHGGDSLPNGAPARRNNFAMLPKIATRMPRPARSACLRCYARGARYSAADVRSPVSVIRRFARGAATPARLERLRAELKRRGLDGFVVPRADRQQNEYLPASEERLAWLTGFTGSAGAAVVLAERAAVFVDGRYTVQAAAQIDAKLFAIEHLVNGPPEQWLEQNLKSGAKLGYDPWLHTSESAEKLRKVCATAGAELVAVDGNPIDALWSDRPAPPAGPVTLRDIKFAGESAADKLKRIRAELHKLRADVLVVSDPQNVAWAFNIRGADVAHTPLALAFAVIARDGKPALYVDPAKLDSKTRAALEEIAAVRAPDELAARPRRNSRTRPCGSTKRAPPTRLRAW